MFVKILFICGALLHFINCEKLKIGIINDIHLDVAYTNSLEQPKGDVYTMSDLCPKTYVELLDLMEKMAKLA